MNNITEKILNTLETGDALGSPFSGLSRRHIQNHFPDLDSFVDPAPALKGKPEKWTMPGLYTSISQLTLIAGLLANRKGISSKLFLRHIRSTPQNSEDDYGIFRNPDYAERSMLMSPVSGEEQVSNVSSARIIIPTIILPLINRNRNSMIQSLLEFTRGITENPFNITGAAILSDIIHTATHQSTPDPADLLVRAAESTDFIKNYINSNSGDIFNLKINPDYLSMSIKNYENIFEKMSLKNSTQENEELICGEVNTTVKSPITRATVNTPLAILPFSLAIAASPSIRPDDLLFTAASMGGEASPLAALAGIFYTLCGEYNHITDNLSKEIVNRKRIMSLNGVVASGKDSGGLLEDFIRSETSLTAKLISEKNSRLKHRKKGSGDREKSKKQARNREDDLSRHVVESWTKIDQAKWRKGKHKIDIES